MAVNKVEINGQTVIDLTADTVTEDTLEEGIVAHDASGRSIVGTRVQVQSDWAQTDPTAPDYIKNKVEYDDTELRDKINQIEMAKFPNATIIGTPTINQGQISGFSTTSYLQFPFVVNFQDRPFEINFEITTGTDITNQQNILDSSFGLAFAVRNGRFVIALSTDGVTWNLGEGIGSLSLVANTTYKIHITWDGTTYKVDVSTNGGESYVTDITKTSNKCPYPKQIYIGVGVQNGVVLNTFKGIINMNYASLYISNKLVWQGMDDVGIATRLAVDLSNIDEAGVDKVKEIVGVAQSDCSQIIDLSDYMHILIGDIPNGVVVYKNGFDFSKLKNIDYKFITYGKTRIKEIATFNGDGNPIILMVESITPDAIYTDEQSYYFDENGHYKVIIRPDGTYSSTRIAKFRRYYYGYTDFEELLTDYMLDMSSLETDNGYATCLCIEHGDDYYISNVKWQDENNIYILNSNNEWSTKAKNYLTLDNLPKYDGGVE